MKKPAFSSDGSTCVGLLASEVCTRGGIQSFMLRIAEVIGELVQGKKVPKGYCISLNDSTGALRHHPAMPVELDVWGAGRSKRKLIAHALACWPPTDVLFVGHVGQAPVAHALKVLGRVRKYYVILHGIEAWKPVSFLQRRALLGADGIIATTRFTAEECARHNRIPIDRFHIIPLCADERKVAATPGFRLNGEFKLLCVARQDASERYKGFEQIFMALALLKQSHPGIHLNLVGKGNDQPRLISVAQQLGVRSQVTFWGVLSDENLAAAYEDCDVFVMPSKSEGFGIVFLEAMQRGKPCIGGNHGGTPEVIEHGKGGYLVEYDDANTLAGYVLDLANNVPLQVAVGEFAKQMIEKKFSRDAFRSTYINLIAG